MSEKFAKSKGGPLYSATSDVLVKIGLSGDAILAYDLTPHEIRLKLKGHITSAWVVQKTANVG